MPLFASGKQEFFYFNYADQMKWTAYRSRSGNDSGVKAYAIMEESIAVKFASANYIYSYASCGKKHVEKMKELAQASRGLSTYIAVNHPRYESRE